MKFPVYRKYRNELSWFRIESSEKFEEIRKIGTRFEVTSHEVRILPDRNMLHDLLYAYENFAVEITSDEYSQVRKSAGNQGFVDR